MNKIRIAQKPDWTSFFALADAEGWRVPEVERQLFAGGWCDCAQALEEDDRFSGLVTAVAHQHSGWIGNLIVPERLRGRGYGSRLFEAAFSVLQGQGMTSVWLTASASGRPIYEKSGFVAIDEVERWVSCKRAHFGPADSLVKDGGLKLVALDRVAWGEDRSALLEALDARGEAYACGDAVALLQREPGLQIVGPWYSSKGCPRSSRLLLQKILAEADPNVELVVDVLKSSPVRQLLSATGFSCVGSNALMVQGDTTRIQIKTMASLASLGSIG
jgi:GNAT superfamily N-acetyltransferase